ncbi:MAG: MFS transporter [Acidimicrobiia bacterium]|nr:MFS transporter [Acidimicrobiia bacterium]
MFTPTRLAYAVRPNAPLSVVAAAVALAAMFAATPFLIPAIAGRYGVSEGSAGLISVTQVAMFALFSFALPKLTVPSGGLLRTAAAFFLAVNLASAFMSVFWILIGLRLVAGAAAGTITWIVWAEAMGDRRSMASISATGPLTAFLGSPILALVAAHGDRWVYGLLTVIAIPAVVMKVGTVRVPERKGRVSRSRSNRVLLFALFLLSMAGSSLFVFTATAAVSLLSITPTAVSFGYSLNAAAGLVGARLASRHRRPGWWLASTGPAAVICILGGSPVWYFFGMAWWGFAFWMGVPGVLQMLSDRSLDPAERAGDAQAFMAMGRSFGPLVGAGFVDAGAYASLAVAAGVGLAVSGATVIGVQEGRHRLPPTPL